MDIRNEPQSLVSPSLPRLRLQLGALCASILTLGACADLTQEPKPEAIEHRAASLASASARGYDQALAEVDLPRECKEDMVRAFTDPSPLDEDDKAEHPEPGSHDTLEYCEDTCRTRSRSASIRCSMTQASSLSCKVAVLALSRVCFGACRGEDPTPIPPLEPAVSCDQSCEDKAADFFNECSGWAFNDCVLRTTTIWTQCQRQECGVTPPPNARPKVVEGKPDRQQRPPRTPPSAQEVARCQSGCEVRSQELRSRCESVGVSASLCATSSQEFRANCSLECRTSAVPGEPAPPVEPPPVVVPPVVPPPPPVEPPPPVGQPPSATCVAQCNQRSQDLLSRCRSVGVDDATCRIAAQEQASNCALGC